MTHLRKFIYIVIISLIMLHGHTHLKGVPLTLSTLEQETLLDDHPSEKPSYLGTLIGQWRAKLSHVSNRAKVGGAMSCIAAFTLVVWLTKKAFTRKKEVLPPSHETPSKQVTNGETKDNTSEQQDSKNTSHETLTKGFKRKLSLVFQGEKSARSSPATAPTTTSTIDKSNTPPDQTTTPQENPPQKEEENKEKSRDRSETTSQASPSIDSSTQATDAKSTQPRANANLFKRENKEQLLQTYDARAIAIEFINLIALYKKTLWQQELQTPKNHGTNLLYGQVQNISLLHYSKIILTSLNSSLMD